jgi:hypothetical protein
VDEATEHRTSLLVRVLGAISLDRARYAEIDRDPSATWQAGAIVTIVGLANGAGVFVTGDLGAVAFVSAFLGNILAWLVFAGFAYVVGVSVLPGDTTEIEATATGVRRALGFAQAPNVLGAAPFVIGAFAGALLVFAGFLWVIVCGIVSLSVSLRVSSARAVAIALVAAIPTLIVLGLFIALFDAFFV